MAHICVRPTSAGAIDRRLAIPNPSTPPPATSDFVVLHIADRASRFPPIGTWSRVIFLRENNSCFAVTQLYHPPFAFTCTIYNVMADDSDQIAQNAGKERNAFVKMAMRQCPQRSRIACQGIAAMCWRQASNVG